MNNIFNKHRRTLKAAALILAASTGGTIIVLILSYLVWSFIIFEWFVVDWIIWGRILRAWCVFVLLITVLAVVPGGKQSEQAMNEPR